MHAVLNHLPYLQVTGIQVCKVFRFSLETIIIEGEKERWKCLILSNHLFGKVLTPHCFFLARGDASSSGK